MFIVYSLSFLVYLDLILVVNPGARAKNALFLLFYLGRCCGCCCCFTLIGSSSSFPAPLSFHIFSLISCFLPSFLFPLFNPFRIGCSILCLKVSTIFSLLVDLFPSISSCVCVVNCLLASVIQCNNSTNETFACVLTGCWHTEPLTHSLTERVNENELPVKSSWLAEKNSFGGDDSVMLLHENRIMFLVF